MTKRVILLSAVLVYRKPTVDGRACIEPRYWPRAIACCGLSPRVLNAASRFKRAPLSFKTFPGFFHTISIPRHIWVDDTGLVGMMVITESTAVRGMAEEDT